MSFRVQSLHCCVPSFNIICTINNSAGGHKVIEVHRLQPQKKSRPALGRWSSQVNAAGEFAGDDCGLVLDDWFHLPTRHAAGFGDYRKRSCGSRKAQKQKSRKAKKQEKQNAEKQRSKKREPRKAEKQKSTETGKAGKVKKRRNRKAEKQETQTAEKQKSTETVKAGKVKKTEKQKGREAGNSNSGEAEKQRSRNQTKPYQNLIPKINSLPLTIPKFH